MYPRLGHSFAQLGLIDALILGSVSICEGVFDEII